MATTYIQFYQSPMVHTSSPYQLPTPVRPHPTLQLSTLPSPVPTPAPSRRPRGTSLNAERKSVPPQSRTTISSTTANNAPTTKTSTTTPGPMNPQETSLFFRLPAELRNEIYKSLLCPDTPTPAQLARSKSSDDLSVKGFNQTTTNTTLYPSILSTCRRINSEATSLLYAHNTFHTHPSLLTSLPHLASTSRPVLYSKLSSQIKRWQVSLRLDTDPRFTREQVTSAFSGAEFVEIRVWQAQFAACDFEVLRLFTGIRGVGVARVGGSVDEDVARGLERLMMMPAEHGHRVGGDGEECGCDEEGDVDMEWGGKTEVLCGRCYRKSDIWSGFGKK